MHGKGQWTANMDPLYMHLTAEYYTLQQGQYQKQQINYRETETVTYLSKLMVGWKGITDGDTLVSYTDAIFSNMVWSVLKKHM